MNTTEGFDAYLLEVNLLNYHFMSSCAFISILIHLMLLLFNKLKNVKGQQNHPGNYVSIKLYDTGIEYPERTHLKVTHYHI